MPCPFFFLRNKRVAFSVMYVSLEMNGDLLEAPEAEVVDVMLRLAAGEMEEKDLAGWRRRNSLAGHADSSSGDKTQCGLGRRPGPAAGLRRGVRRGAGITARIIGRSRRYAFLDVLAKNVSRIWSTLPLPHFGHFLFPSSYSLKERISWNRRPHFLHLYE